MEKKLNILIDKIYESGVEKASADSETILSNAKNESESIVAEAHKKADEILKKAEKEAENLRKSVHQELNNFASKAVDEIQNDLVEKISSLVLSPVVATTVIDEKMLSEMVIAVSKNLIESQSVGKQIDLLLPENSSKELNNRILKQLELLVKDGLEVSFSKTPKSGFEVVLKDKALKLSFSDDAILNLFKKICKPSIREYLFAPKTS